MRVRRKADHMIVGCSSGINTFGFGEFIVIYSEGDASSEMIRDYEFFSVLQQKWMDLVTAIKDKRVVETDSGGLYEDHGHQFKKEVIET